MRYLIVGFCLLMCTFATGMDSTSPKDFVPSVTVRCHGKLRTGVVSIGGETTGTTITFQKRIWELMLQDEESTGFAENHNKEPITAIGTLRKVQGTETKTRWIIDVKTLEERDDKVTAEGLQLTVQGILRSVKHSPDQTVQLSVEAGNLSWPIEFPMDPKLQAKAETLVGQPVNIHGSLETGKDGDHTSAGVIQVKTFTVVEKSDK